MSTGSGHSDNASSEISEMLEKSKREGEKRRMRITGTCLLVGIIGSIAGTYIFLQRPNTAEGMGHPNLYIGLSMNFASGLILLLGVLPTDKRAIRMAHGLVMFILVISALATLLAAVLFFKKGLDGDIPRKHRSYWAAVVTTNIWFQTGRLTTAFYLPQRERLEKLWRVYGTVLMTTGSAFIPLCAFLLYDMPHLQRNLPVFGGFLTVLGVLSAWPNFRMRAQALLSNCLRSGFKRYLRRPYRCTGIPLTVYWYDMYTGISRTGTKT